MVIEFCGLPGCGKSSLLNGCKPNYNVIYDRRKIFKKVRYQSQYFKILPGYLPLKKEYRILLKFIKDYPDSNKVFRSKLLRLNYALNNSSNHLVLLDEGPVQYLTSIPFDKKIIENDNLENAVSVLCKNEKMVFYCNCPVELSVNRLVHRKKEGYTDNGRYDIENAEELRKLLTIKEKNIKAVLQYYRGTIVEIDMNQPPEINIQLIKEKISELYGDNHKIWNDGEIQ